MNEDNRDPLDPSRKFSEGGGQEHRWALGIDCPVCPSKAGAWCAQVSSRTGRDLREGGVELRDPPAKISTWSLHGARINEARDPELLYAQIAKLRAALTEALDLFDVTWCTEHGHSPSWDQLARAAELRVEHDRPPSKDQIERAVELRKLVKP